MTPKTYQTVMLLKYLSSFADLSEQILVVLSEILLKFWELKYD
jgi:hypothetical protein